MSIFLPILALLIFIVGNFLITSGIFVRYPEYLRTSSFLTEAVVEAKEFPSEPVTFPIAEQKTELIPVYRRDGSEPPLLTARSALVVDVPSNTFLFEKESDHAFPLASITKILTAMVVLDSSLDLHSRIQIKEEDARDGRRYVFPGEEFTLKDLLYASLVASANDATVALARTIAGSEEQFVQRMNEKAYLFGLTHSVFFDATGLRADTYSTARDISELMRYAIGYPDIVRATQTSLYTLHVVNTGKVRTIESTDLLLQNRIPITVGSIELAKTGYIPEGGFNFSMQIEDTAGRHLRVVVLGSADHYARFNEAQELVRWAVQSFIWPGNSQ